jgi:hypothetical protein
VIISQNNGGTWQAGSGTPALPSKQGWGEAMVAELANGSVVLTSRLKGVVTSPHWCGKRPLCFELTPKLSSCLS